MNDIADSGECLEVFREGPIAVVRLNRPEQLNAVDRELHHRLSNVWHELDADPDIRAVVLTGAGRAFSAGGDVDFLQGSIENSDVRSDVHEEAAVIIRGMLDLHSPIIAAVNGPAVGLGCSLATLCDVVLVEESAYMADPHVRLGLVAADGGGIVWPHLTSLNRAKEYILLGDKISAGQAVEFGLANRVVPDGASFTEAMELAARFAALPPFATSETRKLLNGPLRATTDTFVEAALESEKESFDTAEFRQNLDSLRKRQSRSK
jgi:enoyl-CoA hydratase